MSKMHLRHGVAIESLEPRRFLTAVPGTLTDASGASGKIMPAAYSTTSGKTQLFMPSLSLSVDGILSVVLNGWRECSLTQTARGDTRLTFLMPVADFMSRSGPLKPSTFEGLGPLPTQLEKNGNQIELTVTLTGSSVEVVHIFDANPPSQGDDSRYPAVPAGQTPSDPAPGIYDDTQKGWEKKLKQQLEEANNSKATVAFFGDSHIERYPYYGGKSWAKYFPDALNLGLRGDSTRQLLQRINAGLFDRFKPKTLVMMFGTNNFNDPATGGSDTQIEAGIQAVLTALRRRLPDTKFVLISMLPRNSAERNTRIQHVNSLTADFARKNGITFLDIYDHFVGDPIRRSLYFDKTHLNAAGYRLLSNYLVPLF